VQVERLQREYDVSVTWAPFLLDPSTPPEGKPARYRRGPDDPPSPAEERAARDGLRFVRGRERTSYSQLALEAAAFGEEVGLDANALHRSLFRAYFEELRDLGDPEAVVEAAARAGADPEALRAALTERRHRAEVERGVAQAQTLGVTGIPTFVFQGRYAIVGAQEYPVFQSLMEKLGQPPPGGFTGERVELRFPGE
jgi:predicted DsbA family dithiol-disulfide isomerase